MSGSGSSPGYDGTNLCRRGDVVVVTINHRLNVLGFTFWGDLGGADLADTGNVGMLDIVQALRWVRHNIEHFGGDPGRVMIFGESGGGRKVGTLLAMPEARGLFHAAAIQSGPSIKVVTREAATSAAQRRARRAADPAQGLPQAPGSPARQADACVLRSEPQAPLQSHDRGLCAGRRRQGVAAPPVSSERIAGHAGSAGDTRHESHRAHAADGGRRSRFRPRRGGLAGARSRHVRRRGAGAGRGVSQVGAGGDAVGDLLPDGERSGVLRAVDDYRRAARCAGQGTRRTSITLRGRRQLPAAR